MIMIRLANPQEYPHLTEIWQRSVRATHDFLSEQEIARLKVYVAPYVWLDNHMLPQGFVGVVAQRIEMLFVEPDLRGQGIGRQLVNFAVTELAARELDVNQQNPQGTGFYLSMGFVVTGRSALDAQGNPYPLLHMRLAEGESNSG
ncbi:hypothetical protein NG42_13970 [Winslowiella iniecta]|uniref:N-acetyltransferase domain-containing protein n=2 Tax=Winslowiella iniecta TaxID=1560201 RepID=A0A0L7TBM5_9GAMM|nr:hypothetical protein NG42_13970 [Winslowiella iniecta]KOC92631.1 hypothetical protein NG43_12795 [Winslowiella iniecta]